ERFDWSAKIQIDKARLTDLFGLHFIERKENVVFCGPVGVGKSFLAQALGHAPPAAPITASCSLKQITCSRLWPDLVPITLSTASYEASSVRIFLSSTTSLY